ncbi:MAG TPA: PD-(D/E)XK nuclease family protein [Burkholderiaceae bacterium]|nr:PD-(D/E)XK nuclease family protein [Burkholderiaceae bacterium]
MDTFESVDLDRLSGPGSENTLVLTVNNRHARRVLAELSAGLGPDRSVMAVPDILPLSAWLRRAADRLSFVPESRQPMHVLDAFGSQLLWQRVIAEAEADHVLLDVPQAARLAAEADRLVDDWRIQVPPEYETSDYQRFRVWRRSYRAALERMDMEDGNTAYERISGALADDVLRMDVDTLVMAGFNELSPRLSAMLSAMRDRGLRVCVLARPAQAPGSLQRAQAPDPDGEWRLAANWAAQQLAGNPAGRYAIVAARLEADVALAHRYLRAALGRDARGRPMPYNVAVARPLAQWPAARAALLWLRVMADFSRKKSCAPADAGAALLAGGCRAHSQEAAGRAAIDALWRRRARIKVSEAQFAAELDRYAPSLGEAWRLCRQALEGESGSAAADTWSRRFRLCLQALGFPGQSVLDSHAFQAVEAFDGLLDGLGRQAAVAGRLDFSAAVSLLRRLAQQTPFQPQRDPEARLDVLGFLESEGGRWDGVWVLGLTDEVLPAAPKPNPFIPMAVLRQANAPRATPERELQWAMTMYAGLLECAPQVWLSHAQREGERELRPSPCIAELDVQAPQPAAAMSSACRLEQLLDEQGPPLQSQGGTRGGIAVIDTQARNPLWAFVKYRLGASQLKGYAEISDQNARGLLLHRAIELVWRVLEDQQGLLRLWNGGGLDTLLRESVRQACDECLADYGPTLQELESARAIAVLHEWLALERARRPFRVRDVEQEYKWLHGPLELSLRLDRIDELDDGRLALIDYKSGNGNIDPKPDWMRARPVGLQLPFYAAVLAEEEAEVAALVLARLHARDTLVKGLADADYGFTGLSAPQDWPDFAGQSWAGLMAQWRGAIHALADEYVAGHAGNRTLRADDLRYCDVLPFLRLTEEYRRDD